MRKQRRTNSAIRYLSAGIGLGLLLGVAALFRQWDDEALASHPRPVQDYVQAMKQIEKLKASEPAGMNVVCHLQWMTHGEQTERAIVFAHGYTTCPQQFATLGKHFYDLGYNVLIAPLPHHGLADRTTRELAKLTAEELAAYGDEVVDIAQGLGKQVTVAGFSGGGVVAAWVAQHRADVDRAVVISPGFGVAQVPAVLTTAAANAFIALPDFYLWWDSALREKGGTAHAYAGLATRGLAQIMRLGTHVRAEARLAAPAAKSIIMVTNASDNSINRTLVDQVVADWRKQGAAVSIYEFAADLQLEHDLIDPAQPKQRVDVVYPILVELVTK